MDKRPILRPGGMGGPLLRVDWIVEAMTLSGGVRVIVELAEGLAERGHQVRIVTKDAGDAWIRPKIPVVVVPSFSRESLTHGDVAIATWFPTVTPTLRAGRYDRLFHFCQGYEGLHDFLAHRLGEIEEAYAAPLTKIVVSPHLVDLLAPRFPGPYFAVPPFVRADVFAPDPVERTFASGARVIGLPGPFEWAPKGVTVALKAVRVLRRRGAAPVLHRLSPTPLSAEERQIVEPNRYEVGRPAAEMPTWYQGLDLLLFPSFPEGEGLGLPPLEAMASGVPVVMTDIPSLRFVPQGAVSRVTTGDFEAMAAEAVKILGDQNLWRRRRVEGLRFAATLRPERTLDRLEELLGA